MSTDPQSTGEILTALGLQDSPGSTAAQIALVSARITNLQNHLTRNKKDKHSRRGLLQMVADRRKLIKYMKRRDQAGWVELARQLGLKA